MMLNDAIDVITIDGPSGSGKGTLAKAVAQQLGWHFLDSGALYRALAYYADQQGIAPSDEAQLAAVAMQLPIQFEVREDGSSDVIVDQRVCTAALRTEKTGGVASQIAAHPGVRQSLLALQQGFRKAPGLVADGRDMGTVVFQDAPLKFYLTASPKARAQRRYFQLNPGENDVSLAGLEEEIRLRDERDENRAVAPLKPAPDAILIDSTHMTATAVLSKVLAIIDQSL